MADDIFVVVLAPSRTIPAAVYGPFSSKHAAHVFIEDKLGQDEYARESDKRAFVVRGYGVPENPAFVIS